jgi:hypothetical protein
LPPESCMRLGELTAPRRRAASVLSGHQNVVPFGPAPPCLALSATGTRHCTSNQPGAGNANQQLTNSGADTTWRTAHRHQCALTAVADFRGATDTQEAAFEVGLVSRVLRSGDDGRWTCLT